jgi:alanine dehydrogenase
MMIGLPRETKPGERRVALLPEAVQAIAAEGHDVFVETRAGQPIGIDDDAYREAGAEIVTRRDVWDAELMVKVKEMRDEDLARAPRGVAVFGFHHLIGAPERARRLAEAGLGAIAFELVHDRHGRLPILAPMSRIAGRMAIEAAARRLGHAPRRVLVLGAGPQAPRQPRPRATRGGSDGAPPRQRTPERSKPPRSKRSSSSAPCSSPARPRRSCCRASSCSA